MKIVNLAVVFALAMGIAPAHANHHEDAKHGAAADKHDKPHAAEPHAKGHHHDHAAPASFVGGILVDAHGMTLYSFDKDARNSGKSACNGDCIAAWPALAADEHDEASGKFSVITRDDGSHQWAYDGWPLYLWQGDKKAGDKTGDKFLGIWHVIKK